MIESELQDWIRRCNGVFRDVERFVESLADGPVKKALEDRPRDMGTGSEVLRIAVAGQYSAGKSTLLRALTGRADIAVGAKITTDEAQEIEWEGVLLVDTPGVHRKLRPDHDERAYEAISKADLLIFVVSNELFDDHIAAHFRKLAIDHGKGHEMLLVVNKMQRHALGNTAEAQGVIRQALADVIAPFTPADVRLTFLDAEYACRAQGDADARLSELMLQKSGLAGLVESLNRFVRESGVMGRYSTPLFALQQALHSAAAARPESNPAIQLVEDTLVTKRRQIVERERALEREVRACALSAAAQSRSLGEELAAKVDSEVDQARLEAIYAEVEESGRQVADGLAVDLERCYSKALDDFNAASAELLEGESLAVLERYFTGSDMGSLDDPGASIDPKWLKAIGEAGEGLSKLFGPRAGSASGALRDYSETPGHRLVKGAADLVDHKFKPWEAVKATKFISTAGRVFGVAANAATVLLQIKSDLDAKARNDELRRIRDEIRSRFTAHGGRLKIQAEEEFHQFGGEVIAPELRRVDRELRDLRQSVEASSDLERGLLALQDQAASLVDEMHSRLSPGHSASSDQS